jgi:hypothetical protein
MRALESQWWIIELPDEWDAEQEDETIIISDEDGVSEIAITTLVKASGEVDDAELQNYCSDVVKDYGPGQAIQLEELQGYYFAYQDQGDVVREWYLRHETMLLLITYSCEAENAGMDDVAVDQILSTLFIKPDQTEATS